MKKLICIFAALCISSAASADYLQIADEARERGADGAACEELREYVYASGAAESVENETKRLFIVNYDLNREKQKSDYAQSFSMNAYEKAGKPEELDFLSKDALAYSQRSNELQGEISLNEDYLSRLNSEKANLAHADELMSRLEEKEASQKDTAASAAVIAAALILAASAVCLVMMRKWMENAGMAFRDLKRFLYKGRYLIFGVGLVCAIGAAAWQQGYERYERIWDAPPVPKTEGEYIRVVEELTAYCDYLTEAAPPQIRAGAENIKKYQLTSAMAEILNNRVAADIDAVVERYTSLGEKYRRESSNLEDMAWQTYNNAVNGPKSDFPQTMKKYVSLGIEAGNCLADAEYCENIAALMSLEGKVDPNGEAATEELIAFAVSRLEELVAPVKLQPPVSLEAAAAAGYLAGTAACAVFVLAWGFIALGLRLRKQRKFVNEAQNGEVVEKVNFRG